MVWQLAEVSMGNGITTEPISAALLQGSGYTSLGQLSRPAQHQRPQHDRSRSWLRWGRWLGLGILLALSLPIGGDVCWAQSHQQIWSGTGQILSGQGQGATVQLVLWIHEGRIWTQSGPELNAPYVPFNQQAATIQSGGGMWQLEYQGDHLTVTFYRGDQIIRYQLQPAGVPVLPQEETAPPSAQPPAPPPASDPQSGTRPELQPTLDRNQPRRRAVPVVDELIIRNR